MSPRRIALALLLLNALMSMGIAWRYAELKRAWSEYAARREARQLLESDLESRLRPEGPK